MQSLFGKDKNININLEKVIMDFLLTLGIGFVVGFIFMKMKVPGGMIIGGIVGTAFFNITTAHAYMPAAAKLLAQIIAGGFIGMSLKRDDLQHFKRIWKPALVLIAGLLTLNISSGLMIYYFTNLDLPTALMSAVPGGISDIPLISAEMGADISKVAAMQFARLLAGIGVFPAMIACLFGKEAKEDGLEAKMELNKKLSFNRASLLSVPLAIAAGLLGRISGIPAGALIFSLVTVMLVQLTFGTVWFPKKIRRFAQLLSGCYIGSGVIMKDVLELKTLTTSIFILIMGYLLACFVIGWILHKTFNMSLKESMLAATPAGATDMALIAADLGIRGTDVVILQVIRLIFVVIVFPQVINLIISM